MLHQVVKPIEPANYASFLTKRQMAKLESSAEKLRGKKIYEINSTATGGGVVELLQSQIPLMQGLGLQAEWLVLPPDERFFAITKQFHNALQGGRDSLPEDLDYYDVYTQKIAATVPRDGDIYILHDPQTLGLIPFLADKVVVWRCHIDLTNAEPHTFSWLRRRLRAVDGSIFSLPSYTAGIENTHIVYPSIDPLRPKNTALSDDESTAVLTRIGVDVSRPFITQISRYDIFKDPIGVLEVVSRVQKTMPDLQCVMLGNYADDDPEGEEMYLKVREAAKSISRALVLVNVPDNEKVVNALQSRAAAVMQYSSKEGFGLTVTEAMWKGALVCARPVGGISLQIKNRKTGIVLTGNHNHDADRIIRLLSTSNDHQDIREAARAHVEKNFITPVMLNGYLDVYQKIAASLELG